MCLTPEQTSSADKAAEGSSFTTSAAYAACAGTAAGPQCHIRSAPADTACAPRQALHRGRLTQQSRTRDPRQIEQAALDQVLADAQVRQLGDRERGVLQQHVGALDVQVHQLRARADTWFCCATEQRTS